MKLNINLCFLFNFIFKNVLLVSPYSSLANIQINNFKNTNINLKNDENISDFKIEAVINNEKISLIPLMNCSIIILYNYNNNTGNNIYVSGETLLNNKNINYSFYNSKFQIFQNNSIDLTYGYASNTNISLFYNNFNGILGLGHDSNLSDYVNNTDKVKDTFSQLNINYIIFEPYYNITNGKIIKKEKQNIVFEEKVKFTHGFDIDSDYKGWGIKLVAIFFDDKKNISRDGTRVQLDDKKTLIFEEGYQSMMIMDNSTKHDILKVYNYLNCNTSQEGNYSYINCEKQFDMILQIEDYGYVIPKSLIWNNNQLNIKFTQENSKYFYIYPNMHGLFYRKYSKEKKNNNQIFLEPINENDIVDLSGLIKIIIIIIILLVVIIITIFVMRMMKKDTNESVDYNNMQQI